MTQKKSEIPFGAQFSPSQVNLPALLRLVDEQAGDRVRITEAIRDEFFSSHTSGQRWKLAYNTVLALRAYGLLDSDGVAPTELAKHLLAVADSPATLYELFAKHLLVNLRGVELGCVDILA
jgi:hypothetical protein